MKAIKRTSLHAILVLSAGLIVGCSKGDDSKPSEAALPDDISKYSVASCTYAFDEGPAAYGTQSSNVISTYFGKTYDASLLSPVLPSSAQALIEFAEDTNVRFYKTSKRASGSCSIMKSLPSAPSDIENKFKSSNSDNSILGLYLEKNSSGLPSTNNAAAITVREDANKWVLVHEYMHHLFTLELHGAPDVKDAFIKNINTYGGFVKTFERSSGDTRKTVGKMIADMLIDMNTQGVQFLNSYFLEEMSIETILNEKYRNGSLRLVISEQGLNGAAYILVSSAKAEGIIKLLKEESEWFAAYMGTIGETSKQNTLRNGVSKYEQIRNDMDLLKSRARATLRDAGFEFKGYRSVDGITAGGEPLAQPTTGCSKDHGADEVLNQINRINRR